MKINLVIGNAPINGYLTIDQICPEGDPVKVPSDLANLDNLVDHNECMEVLALDCLDYFPLSMRAQLILHWTAKLTHGGAITLSCLDIQEASRLINNGTLVDTVQINRLLFGLVSNTWTIRKSVVPLSDTVSMLMNTNQMDITQIKFNGPFYIITAKRK